MKSPSLYTILKLELLNFVEFINDNGEPNNKNKKSTHKLNNNIVLSRLDRKKYEIKQQYNHLFRIILNNKSIENDYIEDVIFVDCKNNKNYQAELDGIIRDGISVDNKKFRYWGKSASMSRNGILGFISEEIYDVVETHAMLEITFEKTVISKFEAYKCLLLSSCFAIEQELPYMIVVDDYDTVVKDVSIKYVDEEVITYIDKKTNEEKVFYEKVIKEGTKDIDNTFNDGCGLCSFEMAIKWQKYLDIEYTPCAYMLRFPYVKGISVAVDFKRFYKEHNISTITDIWGKEHNVDDIDIILTKSQFKGFKYFKQNGTYSDWERYIALLKKYNYCIGISKWNYSHKDEPKMTRTNYQTLQTLDIKTEDLIEMSSYTRKWIERILGGDLLYVYKYLGISERTMPINNYMKAILLNPQMINDIKVKSYLYGLLKKTINEIKIGKIYLKGAFKILVPDIVMMMEYIGGLEVKGCLKADEMYAKDLNGTYVINRNPHISKSEHVLMDAVNNDLTQKWCGHFANICMLNGYDITAKRLNGAD